LSWGFAVVASVSPLGQTKAPAGTGEGRPTIAILDFGSQYSELIARRIRETQVYSEVVSYRTPIERLQTANLKGIILSGGPNSVYDEGAPTCDPAIWDLGVPVLGVCYGMQLMAQQLGGQVVQALSLIHI
jgi:GMP synthase (glutamine-hydrolysing)